MLNIKITRYFNVNVILPTSLANEFPWIYVISSLLDLLPLSGNVYEILLCSLAVKETSIQLMVFTSTFHAPHIALVLFLPSVCLRLRHHLRTLNVSFTRCLNQFLSIFHFPEMFSNRLLLITTPHWITSLYLGSLRCARLSCIDRTFASPEQRLEIKCIINVIKLIDVIGCYIGRRCNRTLHGDGVFFSFFLNIITEIMLRFLNYKQHQQSKRVKPCKKKKKEDLTLLHQKQHWQGR